MVENTIGALEVTTMAEFNTMECMLITRLAITMSVDPKIDEHCTSRNKAKKPNKTLAKPVNDLNQKLTLNNKLQNAFCTQAGLSAEAVDRIWEDAQGNE
jgi:hypothetical protein